MAVYQSTEQFYAVMKDVFDYVMQHPDHVETFTHSNLVIRMNTRSPNAEILLDGRQPPLEVFFGTRPGRANLEISLDADLLHALWMGTESTHLAFLSGQIETRQSAQGAATGRNLHGGGTHLPDHCPPVRAAQRVSRPSNCQTLASGSL
jgi:hypothetical protein